MDEKKHKTPTSHINGLDFDLPGCREKEKSPLTFRDLPGSHLVANDHPFGSLVLANVVLQ